MDETARQLRVALATEGQMGTATITYVWPLITAALEQAHHDGEQAGRVAAGEAMIAGKYGERAARVARGDAL